MANPRIIAGTARGIRLNAVPGDTTRPITDRVKESLFGILNGDVPDSTWFDLFSGTGSVGLEAMSRGAHFARLNDLSHVAIATIRSNMEKTRLQKNIEVTSRDALEILRGKPDRAYDYLYVAPPQYKELWFNTLTRIDSNPAWLVEDGWIIVQIDPIEFVEVELRNFTLLDKRQYGSTLLLFYERNA